LLKTTRRHEIASCVHFSITNYDAIDKTELNNLADPLYTSRSLCSLRLKEQYDADHVDAVVLTTRMIRLMPTTMMRMLTTTMIIMTLTTAVIKQTLPITLPAATAELSPSVTAKMFYVSIKSQMD
jgi:hypothetical protein